MEDSVPPSLSLMLPSPWSHRDPSVHGQKSERETQIAREDHGATAVSLDERFERA